MLLPAVLGGRWAHDLVVSAPKSSYLAFVVGLHVATAVALMVFFWRDWAAILAGLASSLRHRRIATPPLVVRFLIRYFETRTLTPFALYCIAAGAASLTGAEYGSSGGAPGMIRRSVSAAVVALMVVSGCTALDTAAAVISSVLLPSGPPSRYSKVLVIPEENKTYPQIIGSAAAPYLNDLAQTYGNARAMDAGYPPRCPSLAAYILMTSGSAHGICDDDDADTHRLRGANVFEQVARSGRQWRTYAESMPNRCQHTDSGDARYVPRHAPAPYYTSEAGRCGTWDLPMGNRSAGAFHDDLARGSLPAFAFAVPNNCHNMHGAPSCDQGGVPAADAWLRQWIPRILESPDYRSGRLVVVITWDEGTGSSNHIPTLVLSPTTTGVSAHTHYTHCSTLRTVEEILRLPLLGCARSATSMRPEFRL